MLLQAAAQVAKDYIEQPSPLANMLTAAAVSAWTIKKLKEWQRIKWINENSDKINRAVSVGFALATTLGLHIAFHDDATGINHGGILELGLPSASEFFAAIWRTLGSYMLQQGALRGFMTHEAGLKAADAVADVVQDNKERIAAVVERESAPDGSVLKLREKPPAAMAEDVQLEFPWTTRKEKS